MSEVRWIILAIGLLFILSVYVFSRKKTVRTTTKRHPRGPSRSALSAAEPYLAHDDNAPTTAAEQPALAQPETDDPFILAIHIIAKTDLGFPAIDLAQAFSSAGMEMQQPGIYILTDSNGSPSFYAANIIDPGRLPTPDSGGYAPGIILLLAMPGIARPQQALDNMVAVARRLAYDLDGQLEDARHRTFTAQAAQRMRERLAEFQIQHGIRTHRSG